MDFPCVARASSLTDQDRSGRYISTSRLIDADNRTLAEHPLGVLVDFRALCQQAERQDAELARGWSQGAALSQEGQRNPGADADECRRSRSSSHVTPEER